MKEASPAEIHVILLSKETSMDQIVPAGRVRVSTRTSLETQRAVRTEPPESN